MKRNLTTIATLVMMVLSLCSFANEKVSLVEEYATSNIISSYIDASLLGKQTLVKEMLADDFEFINASSNYKATKKEYTKFLENTNNLIYSCHTSYEILDQSGDAAVAKVTMKFENFTRVDIVSMTNTKSGWKITQLISNHL